MRPEEIRRALLAVPAPNELDAERRAWAVVRTAYESAEPERRWRLPSRRALALAAALALVAAALTPPGRALTSWVREAIGIERVPDEDARPALDSLPASGRLLVVAGGSAWVVREDGSKRRLGSYHAATWSPRGLHVGLAGGMRLVAATPEGVVRWTLTKRRRVVAPRWAPSGVRVAYGVGREVRVVHGDGRPDRPVARGVVPGSWSWRPGEDRNVLALGLREGGVRVVDVDALETLWAQRSLGRVAATAWSADGSRLVARTVAGRLVALDGRGRVARRLLPRAAAFAVSPDGRRVAAVVPEGDVASRVVVMPLRGGTPRPLFAGAGRLSALEWSPDGRTLLVAWPSADQWLFLRMPNVGRVEAVSNMAREFDPGGDGAGGAPRPTGWCCPTELATG